MPSHGVLDYFQLKEYIQESPCGGFFERFMSKIKDYFKEIKAELAHVVWPSRKQTVYYTIIVIVLSVVVAYFLGLFDFIFLGGLKLLV